MANRKIVRFMKKQFCTVYFTDLDQAIEIIILESILTTFIARTILRGCLDSSKNWLELKI
jgi:hypothetical protein